tara:strand:- start:529 stop:876 length:348 start_codon:yes stop_codon:yes gene_type:complete
LTKFKTKQMAKFPHQITMAQYNLSEEDFSHEATEALDDFDNYLEELQEKKEQSQAEGKEFELSEQQTRKINRLSVAVCGEIEDMIESGESVEPKAPQPKAEENTDAGFDLFAWMK